jgi:dTDP-4-amino-4,6-dideoxygalactose transaminase
MSLKSIRHNPFKIVKMFEEELCEYTGAPYCVAIDSCTNALLLALLYHKVKGKEVMVPKRTYLSVPQAVILAGGVPVFREITWSGRYKLDPFPIYDSAKQLTSNMYIPGSMMCLSFHIKKQLPIGKGGAILFDDPNALDWFKQMRYEGRSEKNYWEDEITMTGYNFYMTPEEAARGLTLLMNYPEHMPDLEENDGAGYRDLTEFEVFKKYRVVTYEKLETSLPKLKQYLEDAWKGVASKDITDQLVECGYLDGRTFTQKAVDVLMTRHEK